MLRFRDGISLGLWACLLAACSNVTAPPIAKPVFYTELASAEAKVDAASARNLFNGYRHNLGLSPLALDEALMQLAQKKVDQLARKGGVGDGSRGVGDANHGSQEIVSAGYYTVSDAFSGWRGSVSHDRKLRAPNAQRLGIATAYAPNSKYKVYWTVILAP